MPYIRARQESTGQQVAIKAVHGGALLSDSAKQRFDREIRILAELNHPYIVSILDRGTTDEGTPYVVMRYVAGEDLDDWLRVRRASLNNQLDSREAEALIQLLIKICEAIELAHAKGITHRDLKPASTFQARWSPPRSNRVIISAQRAERKLRDRCATEAPTHRHSTLKTPGNRHPQSWQGAARDNLAKYCPQGSEDPNEAGGQFELGRNK